MYHHGNKIDILKMTAATRLEVYISILSVRNFKSTFLNYRIPSEI